MIELTFLKKLMLIKQIIEKSVIFVTKGLGFKRMFAMFVMIY